MTKHKHVSHLPFYVALGCFVVFLWAASLAAAHTITGHELAIFRAINNLPDSWRRAVWLLTQFGSVWALFACTLLLLYKRLKFVALRLMALGTVSFVTIEILKRLIARPRPDLILNGVHLRELSIGAYGFPSGHTAMATILSVVLLQYLLPKQWKPLAAIWVLIVGLSRMYLGAHAPLDILGGVCIGVAILALETPLHRREKRLSKTL